jgi:hypothetical protein
MTGNEMRVQCQKNDKKRVDFDYFTVEILIYILKNDIYENLTISNVQRCIRFAFRMRIECKNNYKKWWKTRYAILDTIV